MMYVPENVFVGHSEGEINLGKVWIQTGTAVGDVPEICHMCLEDPLQSQNRRRWLKQEACVWDTGVYHGRA